MADLADRVAQHDLIYERPPTTWQDGFPIGNGHMGALVYAPEGAMAEFVITKLDVWDRRADMPPKVPFDRFKRLAKEDREQMKREMAAERRGPEAVVPGPKPCGTLRIDLDDWFIDPAQSLFDQTQRLSLRDGTARGAYELSGKASGFTSFVHADGNVLAVQVKDTWRQRVLTFPYTQEITLGREIDADLGMPETGVTDGCLWIHYKFPDGFEYAMAMRVEGVDCDEPEVYPDRVSVKAQLHYGSGELHEYTVYVAVVTGMDSWNCLEAACAEVTKAAGRGFAHLQESHVKWWHAFWRASGVELENRLLECLWYFSLYQFAASSRGEVAPGLFGLWNGSKTPPWSGDYHGDINMVMTYWPVFSANHIELGEPYFKTFERLAPIAKKQTQELYQIDGLKFPIATLDTGAELCSNFYRIMQCTTAFYGLVFWSWYTHTRDEEVLRAHVFPILEEGAKFYLALTEERAGALVIGPSWGPEQGPFPAYNVNNDLGLIKPFWEAYVEACRVLGEKSDVLGRVEACLARFPEYPVKDGEFIDSLTADGFIGLNHPGLLAMVVPGDDVDAGSELAAVAGKTLRNYLNHTNRRSFTDRQSSACDLTWPWLCRVALRLRDVEYAQHLLLDIGVAEFLKPNGFFAFIGGGQFRNVEEKRKAYDRQPPLAAHALLALSPCLYGRERTMSMLQQNSCYIQIVNDMLLQSHQGVIRVFPAVVERVGDCAFKDLRAEGAFLVSARRSGGKTAHVVIRSLAGGQCTVRISDVPDESALTLRDGAGKVVQASRVSPCTWSFETEQGGCYVWRASGSGDEVELSAGEEAVIREYTTNRGEVVTYGKRGRLYES